MEAAASPGWYCPHSFYVLPKAGTAESAEKPAWPWLPALGNGDRNAGLGRPPGPSYCLQEPASRLRGWSRRLLGGRQSPDFFRLAPGQQARTWLGCAWNSGPTKTSLRASTDSSFHCPGRIRGGPQGWLRPVAKPRGPSASQPCRGGHPSRWLHSQVLAVHGWVTRSHGAPLTRMGVGLGKEGGDVGPALPGDINVSTPILTPGHPLANFWKHMPGLL